MDELLKSAREYLRVSADDTGELESPQQQHEVNQRHADRNGWTLGEPYAEATAVSASRYSKKRRDAFGRLVADIEGGTFGAQVLILWESSRGSRRVGEWVSLIEACEDAGIVIYVTAHSRVYDPAEDRDRRSLLEDAVDSEWESSKLSKRLRRSEAARAEAGRPHSKAPFGFRHLFDPVTGRLLQRVEEPAEAAIVRELFGRLHKGDSLESIKRDFAERGLRTRGVKSRPPRPFSAEYLRNMAFTASYAGLRTWNPDDSGRDRHSLEHAVTAAWKPIVDPEVFYAVRERLSDPSRRTSRPGRGKHELSMIARCGQCSGPLTAAYRGEERQYQCREGSHVRMPADDLDQYATSVVLAYLGVPERWEKLRASGGDAQALAAVRTELAAARAELAEWRRKAAAGEVSPASFAAIEPGVIARAEKHERRERELSTPDELSGLLPGDDLAASWEAASVPARRRVFGLLCQPQYLGRLVVGRGVPGHRVAAAERVIWERV